MCWNEQVSWSTFALGTCFNLFNIFYFRDITLTLISIGIQWLLMMQFFEALAWRDQKCGALNKFATNGALVANLTQPIIICLAFIIYSQVSNELKITALAIAFAYIAYILYALNRSKEYTCLQPSESCSHLDLYWWSNINAGIYMIALFAIILLLIRPMSLALFTSGYIALTLIVSMIFYACSIGSMWCWFTAFAPVIIALFWKFYL